MTLTSKTYDCAPDVLWSVERRGIRLLHTGSGGSQMVLYPQAAIWDLVCRNAPGILDKIAIITGLPAVEAERLIAEAVNQWTRDGFLVERVR